MHQCTLLCQVAQIFISYCEFSEAHVMHVKTCHRLGGVAGGVLIL